MNVTLKNEPVLRKLQWLDALLGGVTAGLGFVFPTALADVLGLPTSFVLIVATINLLYAALAFALANQKSVSIPWFRVLVRANWAWTAVSVCLFVVYYAQATHVGVAFLTLQILVVGGLAYVEGNQIARSK